MPIIKKNDVTPERPVIIVLYGTPEQEKLLLLQLHIILF